MVSDPTTPRSLGDKDAAHLSPVTPAEDVRTVLINNLSWGAVLAGVVIALITQVLLNILGLAVGSATIDPMTSDNPSAKLLTFTAAIWWTFSGIIASFVGGLTAGRLSGRPKETTTAWHGLVAWGLTTLIVVFLVSSTVGAVIGGAFNAVGGALGGIGRTAIESAAPALAGVDNPMSGIERQIRTATGSDPQELQDAAVASMQALLTGDASQQAEAREQAAQVLAKAQDVSIEDARQQVAQYEARYKEAAAQAEQKAKEAAEVAAKATARGAAVIFFALLFGALAAWIGGRAGAVEPTVTPGRPGMRVG
jgi:hypothetical protein